MRRKKKTIYITFLDVTKAYDKAWLQAIIYAMHKSGITGELLRLVKKINENLTAMYNRNNIRRHQKDPNQRQYTPRWCACCGCISQLDG